MRESSTQAKNHAFRSMLLMGHVRVWFDRSYEGVLVPEALRATRRDLAYTPDLCPDITDEGIGVTILYGGTAFRTFVPLRAVYRMTSAHGHMTWVEDAPAEARDNLDADFDDEEVEYRECVDAMALYQTGIDALMPTTPTSSEPAVEPSASPHQPLGVGAPRPDRAEGASSSPAVSARAPSPSLTVILGGGGVDSEGEDSEGEDSEG